MFVSDEPLRIPLPRRLTVLLALVAVALVPWALYLTFTSGEYLVQH